MEDDPQHGPSELRARVFGGQRPSRLVDLERFDAMALAAHVRYLESLLARPSEAPPLQPFADALLHRAEELRRAHNIVRPVQASAEAGAGIAALGMPWAGLVDAYRVKAISTACAKDEAAELGQPARSHLFGRRLDALERDLSRLESGSTVSSH